MNINEINIPQANNNRNQGIYRREERLFIYIIFYQIFF
jgi:hypothetical protein